MRNPAPNARARVVVDYVPDPGPQAAGLLRDTLDRVQGRLVAAVVGSDADPAGLFFGYGPALQSFRGVASAGSTSVVYRNGGNAELASGVVDGNPAAAVFAARLRRGRGMS